MFKEIILFVLITINLVNAYPTGAPTQVCANFFPQHKAQAQTEHSPYDVRVKTSLNGVNEFHIIINSNKFRGFIIQARMANDHNRTVDGKFEAIDGENSHTVSCGAGINNTLTHSNRNDKQVMTAKWIPPQNFNKEVVFLATIVKDAKTFWVNQLSDSVSINNLPAIPKTKHEDHSGDSHNHKDEKTSTGHSIGGNEDKRSGSSRIYLNFSILIFCLLLI